MVIYNKPPAFIVDWFKNYCRDNSGDGHQSQVVPEQTK